MLEKTQKILKKDLHDLSEAVAKLTRQRDEARQQMEDLQSALEAKTIQRDALARAMEKE